MTSDTLKGAKEKADATCSGDVWGRGDRVEKQQLTWEELNELERRRRNILTRVELPFWRILTYYDGTCLRALTRDWLCWPTLGVYVFVRMQIRLPWVPLQVYDFGNSDIGIIGGFLSFFLVLFVNQANERMNDQYKKSMDCQQSLFDVAGIVESVLPKMEAARLVRYMNAAHAC